MKKRPSNRLLLELRNSGYSFEKIAALCDTTYYTVRNWLDEAEFSPTKK